MPNPVAEAFRNAARLSAQDARRQGNLLRFAAGEEIVYAGDLHGNRQNLARIIAFCDLAAHPDRRLVLQEIVHCERGPQSRGIGFGDPALDAGGDLSPDVLLRAVRLKLAQPERVYFLIGNHDLAEITGQEIAKGGRGMCRDFKARLIACFGDQADEVHAAIAEFLHSLPLAARCANGAFLTHSLPAPARMPLVDWTILNRPYQPADLLRGGSVYEWTWGRGHSAQQLAELAQRLDARCFLLGHQPVEEGFRIEHGRLVLLATDHAYGAIMVFDAGAEMPQEDLPQHIRPVYSL